MEFKRFLVNKLILFFMLSTLITVAVSLIGSVFDAEARFGYRTMLAPIEYAALCLLPSLVTYSRRELSPRQLLFRKALALLLIEAAILYISPAVYTGDRLAVLAVAASVLVIFVLVHLFLWLKDAAEAKKLNRDLAQFQKLHSS